LAAVASAVPFRTLALLFFTGAFNSIYPGLLGFAVLAPAVLFAVGFAAVAAVRAIAALFSQRWGQAARRLSTGLLALVAIPTSVFLGDYIHLAIFYPTYARAISERGVTEFPWGDTAIWVTDAARLRVLVYDPSGAHAGAGPGRMFVTHLVGPFYVVEDDTE
jgi:hypothetical protein